MFFINNIVTIRYTVNKQNSKSKRTRIKEKWQNKLETNEEIEIELEIATMNNKQAQHKKKWQCISS